MNHRVIEFASPPLRVKRAKVAIENNQGMVRESLCAYEGFDNVHYEYEWLRGQNVVYVRIAVMRGQIESIITIAGMLTSPHTHQLEQLKGPFNLMKIHI